MVEQFTGHSPTDPEEGKERKTSGVSLAWFWQRFNRCPPYAPVDIVERHAHV